VRYSSGTKQTNYGFTGQYSDSYINLLWYNSRHYDPELGRFIQPDSIVPLASQGTQAYDRYGYVNNNPVRYSDPTGHCIFDPVEAILCGAIAYTAITLYSSVKILTAQPDGNNASNIWELMKLGVEQADHANITGEGLQSLQEDKSLQSAQERLLIQITGKPEYGKQAYTLKDLSDKFTANGPSGHWYQAPLDGGQAFWMVHTAILSATNIKVSADGTTSLTWKVSDQFDYLQSKDKGLAYNTGALLSYPIYNGLLGAKKQFPTNAEWNQTIPPPPPTYSCGRCR
jgi:RHS repeat-associated protein